MGCGVDPSPEGLERASGGAAGPHASDHTDGTDDIQDATAAQKGVATAAQITKLDGIEALADVTDPTVTLAAAVIADNVLLRGDGGVRGVQATGITVADTTDNISGVGDIEVKSATGPSMLDEVASATNAVFCPQRSSKSDGLGGTTNAPTMVVGNVQKFKWQATSCVISTSLLPSPTQTYALGRTDLRWTTLFAGGSAFEYQTSAAASYTADAADRTVVLTAATAALVLPDASTTGQGFEILVQFTGATSRTITPAGGDTSDVTAPAQNVWTWLISDGVSNWEQIIPA